MAAPKGHAKYGGRSKGTPNKFSIILREETKSFFDKILDDETEARFWRYFMTGYVIDATPDGKTQILPIPLNPISWTAFKRAVEYKRGMPVQQAEISDPSGAGVTIRFDTVGINAEVLAAKARTLGLGS